MRREENVSCTAICETTSTVLLKSCTSTNFYTYLGNQAPGTLQHICIVGGRLWCRLVVMSGSCVGGRQWYKRWLSQGKKIFVRPSLDFGSFSQANYFTKSHAIMI